MKVDQKDEDKDWATDSELSNDEANGIKLVKPSAEMQADNSHD